MQIFLFVKNIVLLLKLGARGGGRGGGGVARINVDLEQLWDVVYVLSRSG